MCDGLLIHPLVGETKPGDIPADVRMEQIHRLETFAPHLRVEVHAARLEAAILQHAQHRVGRKINARRKLIGIPAQQFVARIRIN